MKTFYRIMLGRKSIHAPECFAGNFIGADNGIAQDLTGRLPDQWRDFNAEFVPIYLASWPEKSKIAAGLACGMLWVVARGMLSGDIVLCPDGTGQYRVAVVTGDYVYSPGANLPHRRPVRWLPQTIDRSAMSTGLKNTTGSVGTVCNISRAGFADEVERLLGDSSPPSLVATDPEIEDPSAFAMEKHLEDFLVQNWSQTELGKSFDIFEEDGELVGQQYPTDTGPVDLLAVSKDQKKLLVVELKKGKASDVVVGQTLRYMGYVQKELAEEGQTVQGVIIALEDDQRIRRALTMVPSIEFYRYQISFKLVKGTP
jgi:restriction system protein